MLVDALPEDRLIYAFALSGDFDAKAMALNGIQGTTKGPPAVTRRPRRREGLHEMEEDELLQAVEEMRRRRGRARRRLERTREGTGTREAPS